MANGREVFTDNKVLTRTAYPHTIDTTTGLDGDIIIARLEEVVFYQYIAARLNIHAVAHRQTNAVYLCATDNNGVAVGRHDIPEDTLCEIDTLDQHILTSYRSDKGGQIDTSAVMTIVDSFGRWQVVVDTTVERTVAGILMP